MLQTQPAATPSFRLAASIVAALVIVAFGPLFFAEFTWWDDQMTLFANPLFRPGATLAQTLSYYWTTPTQGLYVPVTYTVWAIVASMAGLQFPDPYNSLLNPFFFHTLNILTHVGSSLLVLSILRRLIGRGWPALLGAMLFAVHPLQVETVGWVSGFKDLLCWFLTLALVSTYLRAAARNLVDGRPVWRGWEMPVATLLLVLALLSKPTSMVAPAAALLLDGLLVRRRWVRALIDLSPLFAISLGGAVVARVAQYVQHIPFIAPWKRPFVAGDAYFFYTYKLVWPATLTFDYGRTPTAALAMPAFYLHWLAPTFFVLAAMIAWRRFGQPQWLAACAIAAVGIAPVSGLAAFQMQTYSTVTDHYVYFAMLGPALALAWILHRWPSRSLRGITVALIAGLAVRTSVQCGVWLDSFRLFEHGMAVRPDDAVVAPSNLAFAYSSLVPGRPDLAEPYADLAYSRSPESYYVLNSYASTKFLLGKTKEGLAAATKLRKMLQTGAYGSEAHSDICADIAMSLLYSGDIDGALDWAREAVEVGPNRPMARTTIAIVRRTAIDRSATQPAIRNPIASSSLPPASAPAR